VEGDGTVPRGGGPPITHRGFPDHRVARNRGMVAPKEPPSPGGAPPLGYTIPADVFPNGVPLPTPISATAIAAAGTIAPVDIRLAAGTLIPKGAVLPKSIAATPAVGRFGNITVGSGASLNTRGLWVDDRAADVSAYGTKFINGGTITIAANASSTGFGGADNTGDIKLEAGSTLDASSGGHILRRGTLDAKNGVPLGKGGDISI